MWGKPPFYISDNVAVDVRNLAQSRDWYHEKLALRQSRTRREEDSGRPFVDLCFSENAGFISLLELVPGAAVQSRHAILFAKNLQKAHEWLAGRGVLVEPITADSGGNRFFRFRDLDGNAIEVCLEPA